MPIGARLAKLATFSTGNHCAQFTVSCQRLTGSPLQLSIDSRLASCVQFVFLSTSFPLVCDRKSLRRLSSKWAHFVRFPLETKRPSNGPCGRPKPIIDLSSSGQRELPNRTRCLPSGASDWAPNGRQMDSKRAQNGLESNAKCRQNVSKMDTFKSEWAGDTFCPSFGRKWTPNCSSSLPLKLALSVSLFLLETRPRRRAPNRDLLPAQ